MNRLPVQRNDAGWFPLKAGLATGITFFLGAVFVWTYLTDNYSYILLISLTMGVISGTTSYLAWNWTIKPRSK